MVADESSVIAMCRRRGRDGRDGKDEARYKGRRTAFVEERADMVARRFWRMFVCLFGCELYVGEVGV